MSVSSYYVCQPCETHSKSQKSVDFDRRVNLVNEGIGGQKADGAGEHEEGDADQEHVTEEEQTRHEFQHLQFGEEVNDRVRKQVERRGAGCQVGTPPPENQEWKN